MEPDFSGWATKAGLKCSDGRTIMPDAFAHQDKMTVPLVWQHGHSNPENVLGHVSLENRGKEGVYCYAFLNDTPQGQNAKTLVQHEDVKFLSIWANQLVEKSKMVAHGMIREVSLVLAGANPGAMIDFVRISHGEGYEDEVLEDTAIIHTGLEIEHELLDDEDEDENLEHASGNYPADATVQDIYDSMNDEQKQVVSYMIGAALEGAGSGAASHSDLGPDASVQDVFDTFSDEQKTVVHYMIGAAVEEAGASAAHSGTSSQEGNEMHNVFEQGGQTAPRPTLSHDQLQTIVNDAQRLGSLKESFLAHAGEYGIDNIDVLFPDATQDGNGIQIISRQVEWVTNVLNGTKHSPFSRIKSLAADITAEEARARGYVKGNRKKDEVIKMLKRVTTPKTIYKKQKLDRDDIVDITSVDIVAWLKAEMRLMLNEELARAVLIGDGRAADDEDKIDEDHIRPIAFDDDMYNTVVNLDVGTSGDDLVDAVVKAMKNYKGSGTPTLYTTNAVLTDLLLSKDSLGRRLYATVGELAAALRVKDVVEVESMEQESDVVGIIVNLIDYTLGADAGGNVAMFDDFDIDYNQQKYLIETRVSGALTRLKSAITLKVNSSNVVTPTAPTFDNSTGVVTIPSQTGVSYVNEATGATFSTGPQSPLAVGDTVDIVAEPTSGYGFTHDSDQTWTFTRS